MTLRLPLGRSDLVLVVATGVVLVAVLIGAAMSFMPTIDDRARALDSEIRCPVCQGTSIADSPAAFAAEMRAVVLEQLRAGMSDQQLRDFFVERYGVWILLAPPAQGPQLILWLAPAIALTGGALLLVYRARRSGHADPQLAGPAKLGRLSTYAIAAALALLVGVPLAVALVPRGAGDNITGLGQPQGEVAPSITDLETSVARDPRDVLALVALGDGYLDAGRSDAAVNAYLRALEVEPGNVPAALAIGVVLLTAGQPTEAQALFDRVLAASPDQPDALLYRALARYQSGQPPDEVRADALRFLAVAGGDPRRAMAERLLDLASPPPSR